MSSALDQRKVDQDVLRLTSEEAASTVAEKILLKAAASNRRILVGIAGAPGVGKSTLTANVIGTLNHLVDGSAARVPMDGFYMPQARLDALGLKAKRGTPGSFDANGYVALLERVKRTREALPVPTFSRRRNDVVPNAFSIAANVPIIVAEGSYLLLEDLPWGRIRDLLDLCFFVTAPREEVRHRLRSRPLPTQKAARDKALAHIDDVDMANFDIAEKTAHRADLVFDLLHDTKLAQARR